MLTIATLTHRCRSTIKTVTHLGQPFAVKTGKHPRNATRSPVSHSSAPLRNAHPSLPINEKDRTSIHLWSKSVGQIPEQLQQAGINIHSLRKGDFYSADQVNHAYRLIDDKLDERIAKFERGELKADPLTWACQKVIEDIIKLRDEMGLPVVCRCEDGGVRVLTDAEAVIYLNSQANAGLRKHKAKTVQMMTCIDSAGLNEHQKREHETNQRKHAFILASHQGARTQSLRMQRKGLQLPDFTKDLGDKTK